jgi:hypothetical protein
MMAIAASGNLDQRPETSMRTPQMSAMSARMNEIVSAGMYTSRAHEVGDLLTAAAVSLWS